MWPPIIKDKNGIGIKLDSKFWDLWGPSRIIKYHKDLFLTKRKIKSIYCIYLDFREVQVLNEDDLAMVVEYECGEFGNHCIIFSYDSIPPIEYKRDSWSYFIYPEFDIECGSGVDRFRQRLMSLGFKDIPAKTQVALYLEYLEAEVIPDGFNVEEFRKMINKYTINRNINGNGSIVAYKNLLENLACSPEKFEIIKDAIVHDKVIDNLLDRMTSKDFIKNPKAKNELPFYFAERMRTFQESLRNNKRPNSLDNIFQETFMNLKNSVLCADGKLRSLVRGKDGKPEVEEHINNDADDFFFDHKMSHSGDDDLFIN